MAEGKFDVSEILDSIALVYHNITNEISKSKDDEYNLRKMTEMMMMVDSRPTYPSSKLTFSIANITKNKATRFFNIYLNLNGTVDVDIILEDSKRNFKGTHVFFCFITLKLKSSEFYFLIFQFY